jgi:hypothetical protein
MKTQFSKRVAYSVSYGIINNMKDLVKVSRPHVSNKVIVLVLSWVGLAAYLVISLIFSQIRFPNLDEGAYLYKGLQFAQGNYTPFQPYGFWTNKMVLPFYLFGWIQVIFQPGLLAPRLLAVFLGTASVAGLWIVIRRISNEYFAAISVWAMALNATMVSMYSIGNSQVVVIFELIWIMVLVLGENRKLWQLLAGAFIAGMMIFTRENMIFVLPFLAAYCFWQHGKRNGWLVLAAMSLVLVVGHLLFWPDILYLWERQLPSIKVLEIIKGGINVDSTGVNDSSIPLSSRLHSVSIAIRVFLLPAIILGITLFNWKKRAGWDNPWQFKAGLFLSSTLVILTVVHTAASAGQDYCVYCTTNYFAFFIPVCLILIPLLAPILKKNPSHFSTISTSIFIVLFTTIIGYSLFEQSGYSLMNIEMPRLKDGRILSGSVALWQLLTNKFHIDYEILRRTIPAGFGFGLGLILVFLLFVFLLINKRIHKRKYLINIGIPFLVAGFIFTPLLSWPTQETFSKSSVTVLYQQIGKQLTSIARPGDKIYIDGNIASIPLLFTSGVQILPGQVNFIYSFREDANSDEVAQKGLWNEEMAHDWRDQSDFFIIGGEQLSKWYDYINRENLRLFTGVSFAEEIPDYAKIFLFTRNH